MTIEAMKQVLDAWQTSVYGSGSHHKAMFHAITNMVKAIEQAEKQEPVAWIHPMDFGRDCGVTPTQVSDEQIPLYSSPPKPEWVGLTDEEIDEVQELAYRSLRQHKMRIRGQQITPADNVDWHIVCAVEAKLKEKNHG
jgi:hypothetical protein